MKMFNYFVAYQYAGKDGSCGTGNCFLLISGEPLGTEETVREAERSIKKKFGYKGCVITNFIKVGEIYDRQHIAN